MLLIQAEAGSHHGQLHAWLPAAHGARQPPLRLSRKKPLSPPSLQNRETYETQRQQRPGGPSYTGTKEP